MQNSLKNLKTMKTPLPTYTKTSPCTFLLLLLIFLTFSILTLYTTFHHPQLPNNDQNTLLHHYYRNTFLTSSNNFTISTYLHDLTLHPHISGTPPSFSTSHYVSSHFQTLNLVTHVTNFSSLLSYPTFSSLDLHFQNSTVSHLQLSEPGLPSFVTIPYHAYSPSGSVIGKPVFLNYGRHEDFLALLDRRRNMTTTIKGCVGIVRRGMGMSRYEVVSNAVTYGIRAVVMYTETFSHQDGIERGTVMNGVGDPLTPGWAGEESGERLEIDDVRVVDKFPGIPSLPVSEKVAESILESLGGRVWPFEWRRKSGGKIRRVGPGPTFVNFTYEGEKKMATIQNIFAVIKGSEEPDRFVVLGNHRDAWTYGAVDPNSGTAALLDIARRFALLMRLGWKPRRTIVLCSWDAEEFGMIGSTEWVEQNLLNLGAKAVAYFNVDCAAQGPGFFVSATPQLDDLLVEVTKKVKDPDSENVSLYERWTTANNGVNIERLSRVDSDFAPFLHHAGVPSVDLYFGSEFPVYHTAYDSYEWMVNFGDPLFQRHVAVAGVWGLVALHLADDPILPFNYLSYATQLLEYKNVLDTLLEGTISLEPIAAAIEEFTKAANETEEEAKELRAENNQDESSVLRRRMLNDRLMLTERGFLDSEGLHGRQWFKHLIYGPRGDTKSKIAFFPGIADAMARSMKEEERPATIRHEIWRVARAIQRGASALRGELS